MNQKLTCELSMMDRFYEWLSKKSKKTQCRGSKTQKSSSTKREEVKNNERT
jgi:hypothetical protein